MKHLYLWLLCAVCALLGACTQDNLDTPILPDNKEVETHSISVEKALASLNDVLNIIDGYETRGRSIRQVRDVSLLKRSSLKSANQLSTMSADANLVYVVNFENNAGYAVLGADDRVDPVMAVTDNGSLTASNIILRMQERKEGLNWDPINGDSTTIETSMCRPDIDLLVDLILKQNPTTICIPVDGVGVTPSVPSYQVVKGEWSEVSRRQPILKTTWDQGVPYNYFAPKKNGVLCAAGCVPIAVSQVIASNAYRLNRRPTPIGGYDLDWSSILSAMDAAATLTNNTATETLAVARLIRGVGAAVEAQYGTESTTASMNNAKNVFKGLAYSEVSLVDYTTSSAHTMIVDRGLAVCGSGFRDENATIVGHAWVFDGWLQQERNISAKYADGHQTVVMVERRDFVHCNFGWNASCNGYYLSGVFDLSQNNPQDKKWDNPLEQGTQRNYYKKQQLIVYNQ